MFKKENLNKQSSRAWKRIADFLLFSLPAYMGGVMVLPVGENLKLWLNFAITIVVITIKGLSKFTAEEDAEPV